MDAVSQAASQAAAVEQAAAAAAAAPDPEIEVEGTGPSLQEPDAAEQQPQAAAQAASGEPYSLAIPEFVPMAKVTPEREAMVASFAALAPTLKIPAGTAQQLVDAAVDVATTIPYSVVELEYASPEDAM